MATKMKDDWVEAKTDFKTITGKKKPSEKFLLVFRKGSGIESSLGKLDEANEKKDIKALKTALDTFSKAKEKYSKVLTKAISKEEKGTKVALLKALKVLKTRLEKYESFFELEIEGLIAVEEVKSEINPIKAMKKMTAKTYKITIKSAIATSKAAIRKIDSKTDKVTYDKEIDEARILTTALGTLDKAVELDSELENWNKKAKKWIKTITPFASGDLRKSGSEWNEEDISEKVDIFEEHVTGVEEEFEDLIKN